MRMLIDGVWREGRMLLTAMRERGEGGEENAHAWKLNEHVVDGRVQSHERSEARIEM